MALSFLAPSLGPFQRPIVDHKDGSWTFFGGDFKTWAVSGDEDHFKSRQIFKANSPHTGAGRGSTATPPYHMHPYQIETFEVLSGTLCYCIDGKLGKLESGKSVVIPKYQPHTFWNDPSTGTDLDVYITVRGGENPGFDETFVHNFYGYLSSVTMAGKKPNPLQMLRFLDHANVILADPPYLVGRMLNLLLGRWLGGYIFGYKTEYGTFEG
ncbi:hypothetical protein BCR39DRAFT_508673 [Naematelia encephala]|uniref:Cupin type-2 domain-containing protein n=1 Tax=Naematelia encephala TaxID=71784 RepID=A0A1Y2BMC0_9TREE|nr:hypothetical protein BCR39DRAFT_508673 [Naematelia encephala]